MKDVIVKLQDYIDKVSETKRIVINIYLEILILL